MAKRVLRKKALPSGNTWPTCIKWPTRESNAWLSQTTLGPAISFTIVRRLDSLFGGRHVSMCAVFINRQYCDYI